MIASCVPNVTDKTKTIRFNWPEGGAGGRRGGDNDDCPRQVRAIKKKSACEKQQQEQQKQKENRLQKGQTVEMGVEGGGVVRTARKARRHGKHSMKRN